jgi:hypothetical protein
MALNGVVCEGMAARSCHRLQRRVSDRSGKDWQLCGGGEGAAVLRKGPVRSGSSGVRGQCASWEDCLGEVTFAMAAQQRPVQRCLAEGAHAMAAGVCSGPASHVVSREGWAA